MREDQGQRRRTDAGLNVGISMYDFLADESVDISMIVGGVLLGISTVVFVIRWMHFTPLTRYKNTDSNPDIQTMKKLVLEGQGLMLVAFALFCGALYFSLSLPLYVVVLVFVGCVIFTGLDTLMLNRKLRKWFS